MIKDVISTETLRRSIHYAVHRQLAVRENLTLLKRLKENEQLLKRKNRRLTSLYQTANQFVDNVSHEFRTPLTVIKEYSWLIRDGLAGEVNQEQQRMLNVVIDRVDDLNTMVDDMLDMSKIRAGLLGASRNPCSLMDIVRNVLPTLERKAQVRSVQLESTVDELLPLIYCDGEKLGRVVINLVANAIKFCGRPGIVRLWAKDNPQAKEVVIGVTDDGAGIAVEHLEAIFERFKQLENDVDRSTKGFGLGLNIAKNLVELNLGTMRVESKPGQGSTFSFTVPWADPTEVTRRYLSQISELRRKSIAVSLVNAEIDESATELQAHDVDLFLSYQLRRNDLLFRGDPRRWFILLLTPQLEVEPLLERMEAARSAVNRNRPNGSLPEIRFSFEGSWDANEERDAILAKVRDCRPAEEVSCG